MAKRLLPFASFLLLACPAAPGLNDGGTDGGLLQPPELTSLAPTRGSQAGGTLVTLNGTGFSDGIQVFFGGQAGTEVLLASRAKLTVRTP
ncbi:MAG: IPT/TIG domain-containing protein, partial [Myxococcaceae bacterium]|nr:IPT/TIG domain-containing protein [Myxococcaceae bacterium]